MSEKLTDKIDKFEKELNEYIFEKFKDMPATTVMEFGAFLGNKIRMLMIDVIVDTRSNCMREFNKARKYYYKGGKLPPLREIIDNPKGIAGEK